MIEVTITSNADAIAAAFSRAPGAIADALRDGLSVDGAADVTGSGHEIAATMTGSHLAGHLIKKGKDGKFIVLPSMRARRPVVGLFAAPQGDDVLGRVARAIDKRLAAVGLPVTP